MVKNIYFFCTRRLLTTYFGLVALRQGILFYSNSASVSMSLFTVGYHDAILCKQFARKSIV